MKIQLPEPILKALNQGVSYFMGEEYQWKLEIQGRDEHIEKYAKAHICVFANNGYGDYLFLKETETGDGYKTEIYEFFHEGPEINRIHEDLSLLLGLTDRSPTIDDYPPAKYETGELVNIGDYVQFKLWIEFWKGWQNGMISYVPGISNKNFLYEYNNLKWVCINTDGGCKMSMLVHPETGILKKVKFLERSK